MINNTRLNSVTSACRLFLFMSCFIGGVHQICAEDGIVPFDKNFAFNLYGNFNTVLFGQKDEEQYLSKSPWSIGFGIRYKNIAGRFFVPVTPWR
jgi:hypothetical protein